jgi:hypothetical protein
VVPVFIAAGAPVDHRYSRRCPLGDDFVLACQPGFEAGNLLGLGRFLLPLR